MKTRRCKRCGTEHNRQSDYCSQKCTDAARIALKRSIRKADFADNVQFLPLMEFLLDICERQESIAAALNTDLPELNHLLNRCRYLSWASGVPLELSHYKSVKDGGTSDTWNIGIWPRFLNRAFGSQSLPIGRRFNPDYLRQSRFRCSNKREAFAKLSANKDFVTKFKALLHAEPDPDDTFNNIAKPRRYDDLKRLQKGGWKGSLATLRGLTKAEFIELLAKYDLEPVKVPEPDEQQRVELVTILADELTRQCRIAPSREILLAEIGLTPEMLRDNVPVRFREQILFAAITHDYEGVETMTKEFIPNKPVRVIAHLNDKYTTEVHRWRGDDNRWHETELPCNPAQFYTQHSHEFPF
jgi:hypothetical protein